MRRRQFLKGAAALALAPGVLTRCGSQSRPNLLLLTADDMNWDAPASYDGPVPDATPNIDALAAEGMRFLRGHVTISVCRPSRAVMMTGRYPHHSGALGGQPIRAGVPVLTDLLRPAGYRVGILGKVSHLQPTARFHWELAKDSGGLGFGRDPDLYARYSREFMETAAGERQPFFLMVNSHDPHRPFAGSAAERAAFGARLSQVSEPSRVYRSADVTVPGFLPDLPEVRREVAQYYSSVRRCDDTIGAVLEALESAGQAENTLVIFLSDNGMAFPFSKTNCYLNSTRVPWIARWPGRIQPGSVDGSHFVSAIDLMPTLIDAAGLPPSAGVDGRSFLPLLEGEGDDDRDRLVTVLHRDWVDHPLEMRCIHDPRYGYIFNAWADGKRVLRNESQNGLTMGAMAGASASDPVIAARVRLFLRRRPEELYDFIEDPDALHDLSRDRAHAEALVRLRGELLAWMVENEDPLEPSFREYLARVSA